MPSPTIATAAFASRALLGARARAVARFALAALALACAPAQADTLRLAVARAPVSLPLYVAQQRGYFRAEGLDVTIEDCIGGLRCLARVVEDHADVATAAELPVVLRGFTHADVAVVGTMATAADNLRLVARRGAGVATGQQLAGRRVGVILNSAGHYALETHLFNVGVDPRKVEFVPLQAEQMVGALRDGHVDAIVTIEPYGYQATHGANAPGVALGLSGGYTETYDLVASRRLLGPGDAMIARLLRAVERANAHIHEDPADAQALMRQRLGLDPGFVDWVWPGLLFRLALDQSLINTMESESRWAQREGHVSAGTPPNVLTLIYPGPLKSVKPGAVGTGN